MRIFGRLLPILVGISGLVAPCHSWASDSGESAPVRRAVSPTAIGRNATTQVRCGSGPIAPPPPGDHVFVVDCDEALDSYGPPHGNPNDWTFYLPINRFLGDMDVLSGNGLVADSLELHLYVYDVDNECLGQSVPCERDEVYFNGRRLDTPQRFLVGRAGQWSEVVFKVPTSIVNFPDTPPSNGVPAVADNQIRILVDVANPNPAYREWRVEVDWAYLLVPAPTPIALVHGILTAGSGTWNKLPYRWNNEVNGLGIPVKVVDLPSLDGVLSNATRVTDQLNDFRTRINMKSLDVVAHSKGGLDAAVSLNTGPADGVRHLVELGTPNAGTPVAVKSWSLLAPPVLFPCSRDLGPPAYWFSHSKARRQKSVKYSTIAGDWTFGEDGSVLLGTLQQAYLPDEPSDGVVSVSSVASVPYMRHQTYASDSSSASHFGLNASDQVSNRVWKELGVAPFVAGEVPMPSPRLVSAHQTADEITAVAVDSTLIVELADGLSSTITLGVEADSLAGVLVSELGGRARCVVVAPGGLEIAEGESSDSLGVSVLPSEELLGARMVAVSFDRPAAGAWGIRLSVDSTATLGGTVMSAIRAIRSPASVTLGEVATPGGWTIGQTKVLSAAIHGAANGTVGIYGYVESPAGAVTGFVLSDAGSGPDAVAGDGVFCGVVGPFSASGSYGVKYVAVGRSVGDSVEFTRESVSEFTMGDGTQLEDEVLDLDTEESPDGYVETYVVSVYVDVATTQHLSCTASVVDQDGRSVTATADSTLPSGEGAIVLRFPMRELYAQSDHGTVWLRNIELFGDDPESGYLLDAATEYELPNAGGWNFRALDHAPIVVLDSVEVDTIDVNADCLADIIEVRVRPQFGISAAPVIGSKLYRASATLTDSAGHAIDLSISPGMEAQAGLEGAWLPLRFNAQKIAGSRWTGPYQLSGLTIWPDDGDGPVFPSDGSTEAHRLPPGVIVPTTRLAGRVSMVADTITACPGGDGDSLGFTINLTGMCKVDVSSGSLKVIAIRRADSGETQGVLPTTIWDCPRRGAGNADTLVAVGYNPTTHIARFVQHRLSGAGSVQLDVYADTVCVANGVIVKVLSYDLNTHCLGATDAFDQSRWSNLFGGCTDCDVASFGDYNKDDTVTVAGDYARMAPHVGHSVVRLVTLPNGGQSYAYGAFASVQWRAGAGDSSKVAIFVVRDGDSGYRVELARNLSDNGSATVPLYLSNAPQTDYRIEVVHSAGSWTGSNAIGSDRSDGTFTVEGPVGGGCPVLDTWTLAGWQRENTILGRSLTGELSLDACRLKWAQGGDDVIRLSIHEDEEERTTLDQVRLIAIDHVAGVEAFAAGEQVVLGHRLPPYQVRDSGGENITHLLSGHGPGFNAEVGETLYVELVDGSTVASGLAVQNINSGGGFIIDDDEKGGPSPNSIVGPLSAVNVDAQVLEGTGVLIQIPSEGGGWETAAHHYPRERPSQTLFDDILAATVRLVFLDRHHVNYLGRIEASSDSLEAAKLPLASAVHSRLGEVTNVVQTAGNLTTTIERGDTLELVFNNPALAEGRVRDFFLLSHGVYTANLPARSGPSDLPVAFALRQNQPNPFRGTTTVRFELPRAGRVHIEIFDLLGRRVIGLVEREFVPGVHSVEWNQRDQEGRPVRAGVYLYRMEAPGFHAQRKMVILP